MSMKRCFKVSPTGFASVVSFPTHEPLFERTIGSPELTLEELSTVLRATSREADNDDGSAGDGTVGG